LIGKTLAHYRIDEKIGQGGMGEVYRAHDTTLDRDIALKLLPISFTAEPERVARLRREAKVLASLNHSNIAAIHGLEEADQRVFLAMELAEGEDLSQRIASGRLQMEESLEIARAIAQGLEEAHAKGVVHRDLKPANVKVSADGKVKILDFGLARAYTEESDPDIDPALSPTITSLHTQAGTILGTAAYMSPEQARGLPVDKRTDIWAFGVVLYEMLSGEQIFQGDTVSDKLASILKTEPDWSNLPADTPPRVRELLERCLSKHRRDRLQDIGDARVEIEWTLEGRTGVVDASASARRRLPLVPALVAALVLAAVVAAVAWTVGSSAGRRSAGQHGATGAIRVDVSLPPDLRVEGVQVAPNGLVAVEARPTRSEGSEGDNSRLYLRQANSYEFDELDGSVGFRTACFSDDSRWIAMVAPDRSQSTGLYLWKVPVDGSAPPLRVLRWPDEWEFRVHWLADGDLLATTHTREFIRISDDGQRLSEPVKLVAEDFDDEFFPQESFASELPDGVHVLGSIEAWSEAGYARHVAIANIDTGEARVLIENAANPRWLDGGFILFSRASSVLALPFDPENLEVLGGPVAVADGIRIAESWAHGGFEISEAGDLYYAPGGLVGQKQQLAWTDPSFQEFQAWSPELRNFDSAPLVSPDTRHLAITIAAPDGVFETWISEIDQPALRRFLYQKGRDCAPRLWTPSGEKLIYSSYSTPQNRFEMVAVDGSSQPEPLWESSDSAGRYAPTGFADDGSLLLVTHIVEGKYFVLLYPFLEEHDGKPPTRRLLSDAAEARVSPDGKWLVYEANTSGRLEVYLRRWLGGGELGPEISVAAGNSPEWYRASDDSPLEIWFDHQNGSYRVRLTTEPTLRLTRPELLMEMGGRINGVDILTDGRILAWMAGDDEARPNRMNVVLNWKNEILPLLDSAN